MAIDIGDLMRKLTVPDSGLWTAVQADDRIRIVVGHQEPASWVAANE